MSSLIFIFVVIVFAASALASIAVWSSRGPWPKGASIAVSAILMGSGFVGLVELLGVPKPAYLDLTDSATKDAKVLSTSVREGEVVYIWVQPKDSDVPRAYAMPWEDRRVRQLFRALEEANASGSEVLVRGSLLSTGIYEDAPFYVPPHQPLPPKDFEESEKRRLENAIPSFDDDVLPDKIVPASPTRQGI